MRTAFAVVVAASGLGLCLGAVAQAEIGAPLVKPTLAPMGLIDNVHGSIVDLTLGYIEIGLVKGAGVTRGYNGQVPGPTIRARVGEDLTITLHNKLPPEKVSTKSIHNSFAIFDHTNLHAHGLHVSSNEGFDNVFSSVGPGESVNYTYHITPDHMPGTHWYHPHFHGSTAIQAGGGAAGFLIIEDPPGYLPKEIENLEEIELLMFGVNVTRLRWITKQYEANCVKAAQEQGVDETPCFEQKAWSEHSGDLIGDVIVNHVLQSAAGVLINGQIKPTIRMAANRWYRWRMLYAAIDGGLLPSLPGCDTLLIAKDGIYLHTAPRRIHTAYLGPGNRADLLVRCPPGDHGAQRFFTFSSDLSTDDQFYQMQDIYSDVLVTALATVAVDDEGDIPCSLPLFEVQRPCYLADLRQAEVTKKVALHFGPVTETEAFISGYHWTYPHDWFSIDGNNVHGEETDQLQVGTVAEFDISGANNHPVHVHVYPYQMQDMPNAPGSLKDYFQPGDWHDTLLFAWSSDMATQMPIRLNLDRYVGNLVLHCHLLTHEDIGMMINMRVRGDEGTMLPGVELLQPGCTTDHAGEAVSLKEGSCGKFDVPPPLPDQIDQLRATLIRLVATILLGHILKRFGHLPSGTETGIGMLAGKVALPCLFFRGVATMDPAQINMPLLIAVIVAKLGVIVMSFALSMVTTKTGAKPGTSLMTVGTLALLATNSDDTGLGLPVFGALYGMDSPVTSQLFALAGLQALLFNPIVLVMLGMGVTEFKASGPTPSVLHMLGAAFMGLLKNVFVLSVVLGLIYNVAVDMLGGTAGPAAFAARNPFFNNMLIFLGGVFGASIMLLAGMATVSDDEAAAPKGPRDETASSPAAMAIFAMLLKSLFVPIVSVAVTIGLNADGETSGVAFIYGSLVAANSCLVVATSSGLDEAHKGAVSTNLVIGKLLGFPQIYFAAVVYMMKSELALLAASKTTLEVMLALSVPATAWVLIAAAEGGSLFRRAIGHEIVALASIELAFALITLGVIHSDVLSTAEHVEAFVSLDEPLDEATGFQTLAHSAISMLRWAGDGVLFSMAINHAFYGVVEPRKNEPPAAVSKVFSAIPVVFALVLGFLPMVLRGTPLNNTPIAFWEAMPGNPYLLSIMYTGFAVVTIVCVGAVMKEDSSAVSSVAPPSAADDHASLVTANPHELDPAHEEMSDPESVQPTPPMPKKPLLEEPAGTDYNTLVSWLLSVHILRWLAEAVLSVAVVSGTEISHLGALNLLCIMLSNGAGIVTFFLFGLTREADDGIAKMFSKLRDKVKRFDDAHHIKLIDAMASNFHHHTSEHEHVEPHKIQ